MTTFEEAEQVKRKHSARLLKQPGICGVDVQTDDQGQPYVCIHLDANSPDVEHTIPSDLDGVPVKILYTGPFEKQS